MGKNKNNWLILNNHLDSLLNWKLTQVDLKSEDELKRFRIFYASNLQNICCDIFHTDSCGYVYIVCLFHI